MSVVFSYEFFGVSVVSFVISPLSFLTLFESLLFFFLSLVKAYLFVSLQKISSGFHSDPTGDRTKTTC